MSAQNKALIRRYFDTFNKGNLDALAEIVDPGYVIHYPSNTLRRPGPDGLRGVVSNFRSAFPDLAFVAHDMLADGDKVAVRWTFTGTHSGGPYMGVPATGKKITVDGQSIYRIAGGKVVEGWINGDDLGEQRQLGLIPPAK